MFGLVGWLNNNQLVSNYKYTILLITILFSVIHLKKIFGHRSKVRLMIISIFLLYNIISFNNPWVNESVKDLIIKINKQNIGNIDDKIKLEYYNSILRSLYGIKDKYQNEALSMAIEIDRLTNNVIFCLIEFLNYYLYSKTSLSFQLRST